MAAASKVSALSGCLTSQQIVQHIVPCVRELSVDSSQYVRAALASVVMELAPMLGKPVSDVLEGCVLDLQCVWCAASVEHELGDG